MQKTVLNDVFDLLVQIGAVSSESEFSKLDSLVVLKRGCEPWYAQ